jgi:hypothetical protein
MAFAGGRGVVDALLMKVQVDLEAWNSDKKPGKS